MNRAKIGTIYKFNGVTLVMKSQSNMKGCTGCYLDGRDNTKCKQAPPGCAWSQGIWVRKLKRYDCRKRFIVTLVAVSIMYFMTTYYA